jgi:hypothetical protein
VKDKGLALAALIIAIETATGEPDMLRATLPLLGRTVIEHQVRQAVGAGAAHLVLLVERMPAALTAALDRLRRDGIVIDVARTIGDAADRFHPDERLLLIADGCVADQPMLDALAALAPPALMTLPDRPDTGEYERIDATCRWAGLGLFDGAAIRSTAAMLGDWDAQSTLLRRAVQAGARRVDCGTTADGRPRIAFHAQALDGLDQLLLRRSRVPARRWPRRWLFATIDGPLSGWLARRAVDPWPVAIGATALAGLGALAAMCGWRATGLGLALLSGPVAAVSLRLARLRLAEIRHGTRIEHARIMLLAVTLLALAWPAGGTALLAATIAVAAGGATASAVHGLAGLSDADGPAWIADGDALLWAMLPVALLAGWWPAIALAFLYACLSFAQMQALFVAAGRMRPEISAI